MGMKDQMQDKSRQAKEKAQEKAGQARQKAGQQGRQGQPQRGTQNHRDIEDTEQQVRDRFNQDYDA
ncbi:MULTISPECIES: hypothetical protein [Streptomyces]|uniref:CsbD family protein n=2 Tax=Streptomyces eurythermus TaxID=42237 RepID=A0ABW6YUE0_9ACTN|nr:MULTISPECIES: hypothetical protein [Streptomyces]QIS71591.1 hypothetical protein HB370_17525 [Streptomyces sp. DSM 40868]WDM12640.1 hypothetical protein J3S85_14470 [Streptomyces lavenduligriseus]